jgi:hypothetical protein
MFDNISQGLFVSGGMGYFVVVPILRSLAIMFMVISTYKLLRARQDSHKFLWILAICFSPIITRIAFEVYRRFINKKQSEKVKGSNALLIISIVAFVLSVVLTVISIAALGIGYLKSEIDGEPLATFYDVHGNEYHDLYDVPLYDKQGNMYTTKSAWFTGLYYVDENGKSYDGDYCFLSEDGYFFFDENKELQPYNDSFEYYTDGETLYYLLFFRVYWGNDGVIYEKTGRFHVELFDLD